MHLGRGCQALAGHHAVFLSAGTSGATAVTIFSDLVGTAFPHRRPRKEASSRRPQHRDHELHDSEVGLVPKVPRISAPH